MELQGQQNYDLQQLDIHAIIIVILTVTHAIVFVNRDQLTGFGTPWEIRFESNYTVLRKGGNVDGYSALFPIYPI